MNTDSIDKVNRGFTFTVQVISQKYKALLQSKGLSMNLRYICADYDDLEYGITYHEKHVLFFQ